MADGNRDFVCKNIKEMTPGAWGALCELLRQRGFAIVPPPEPTAEEKAAEKAEVAKAEKKAAADKAAEKKEKERLSKGEKEMLSDFEKLGHVKEK